MEKTIRHRAAIRFCQKIGFNDTKTFEMIQKVYSESVVHRATVFHWYNAFSEGRESICGEQRSRRPKTTGTRKNVANIADTLKDDRQSLCRHTTGWMGIPKTIVQQILHEDLQKWEFCVLFMLHALTAKQKKQRPNHTYDLIETIKNDPNFLDCIITDDENWCFANRFSIRKKSQLQKS